MLTLVNNLRMYWLYMLNIYVHLYIMYTIIHMACLFLCSNCQFSLNEVSGSPRHTRFIGFTFDSCCCGQVFGGNCEIAD